MRVQALGCDDDGASIAYIYIVQGLSWGGLFNLFMLDPRRTKDLVQGVKLLGPWFKSLFGLETPTGSTYFVRMVFLYLL